MAFNVTAADRLSRGTMSPIDACHEGLWSAMPLPIRKVKARRSHGVIKPAKAKSVSRTETVSMKSCATSMIRRRSRLSASAPAISAKAMIGSVAADWTRATMSRESVRPVIIQPAPTFWISAPRFDTIAAAQRLRKVGFESRARGDADAAMRPDDPETDARVNLSGATEQAGAACPHTQTT